MTIRTKPLPTIEQEVWVWTRRRAPTMRRLSPIRSRSNKVQERELHSFRGSILEAYHPRTGRGQYCRSVHSHDYAVGKRHRFKSERSL